VSRCAIEASGDVCRILESASMPYYIWSKPWAWPEYGVVMAFQSEMEVILEGRPNIAAGRERNNEDGDTA